MERQFSGEPVYNKNDYMMILKQGSNNYFFEDNQNVAVLCATPSWCGILTVIFIPFVDMSLQEGTYNKYIAPAFGKQHRPKIAR